jgi:cholesterol oxidase
MVSGDEVPVIIVGSGFGGSIAAYNLAQAGVPSVVLERGRWWTIQDPTRALTFPTLTHVLAGDGRSSWMNTQTRGNVFAQFVGSARPLELTTGLIEVVDEQANPYDRSPAIRAEGVCPMSAAGVGGGSLIYNSISYPPLKEAWDVAYPSAELPLMQHIWRDLQANGYFDKVLAMIQASPVPSDVLNSDAYAGTRHMCERARAAGYTFGDGAHTPLPRGAILLPLAVDWNAVRDELAGRRVPSVSIGEAWLGANSGAKRSLDKPDHYLGLALASGLAQVLALHSVTRIHFDPRSERFTLDVIRTDVDYRELERVTLRTRHLIMAAGSIGTTKLLVRARDRGDLPELNAHVGTRWSSNANCNAFRFVPKAHASQGGPAGVGLVNYDDDEPVVLESLPQRVPEAFAEDPRLEPFLRSSFNIGLGIPKATGAFHYDASQDTVVLRWPHDSARAVYEKFVRMMHELGDPTYIIDRATSQRYTAHPLGGVPLGLATDADCRVLGYEHLYAVDGSIIPGSSAAANPSVLIAALAQRGMERIVERIRRSSRSTAASSCG